MRLCVYEDCDGRFGSSDAHAFCAALNVAELRFGRLVRLKVTPCFVMHAANFLNAAEFRRGPFGNRRTPCGATLAHALNAARILAGLGRLAAPKVTPWDFRHAW